MAGFKTHLMGSVLSGAGIALLAYFDKKLNLTQASAIFIVGSIGGLLPDLDSDTSKPFALLFQLISVLIPSVFFLKANSYSDRSSEFIIIYFTVSYLLINYTLRHIIKRMTIHRGIMHSIPFTVLSGQLGYLLFISSGANVAYIAGISVFSGCLMHLLLDEFEGFKLKGGFIPVFKRSKNATVFKLSSQSAIATFFVYFIILVIFMMIYLPSFKQKI
ncbi:MAG: metal-dependent hydrolase [Desulfobacterales bacterium]|nr:metal-dependent hydrolase [Desulfobacterales bacterium]